MFHVKHLKEGDKMDELCILTMIAGIICIIVYWIEKEIDD